MSACSRRCPFGSAAAPARRKAECERLPHAADVRMVVPGGGTSHRGVQDADPGRTRPRFVRVRTRPRELPRGRRWRAGTWRYEPPGRRPATRPSAPVELAPHPPPPRAAPDPRAGFFVWWRCALCPSLVTRMNGFFSPRATSTRPRVARLPHRPQPKCREATPSARHRATDTRRQAATGHKTAGALAPQSPGVAASVRYTRT